MAPSLRHRLFSAGFAAIAATGAERWLAPVARGAGVVLMFHHVRPWRERAFAPNRLLEITPAFLDRVLALVAEAGFEFIPLDALPGRLAAPSERPFAVLTFDDGYRDNVEHALPVLSRHGAPWTLFVTADYADGRGRLWWIELEEAVARLDRVEITLDRGPETIPSATPAEKEAAFERVYRTLRAGPEAVLRDRIAGLGQLAGVDSEALVRHLCLGWSDLRRLAEMPGVTIGAHTLTHPMLAKHDEATARREIAASKAAIESRLGQPVRHLAYPVGDPTSAGPRDFALAREAGFATAMTTRPGHVFPEHGAHLHALPRVSVNGHQQSDAAIRALLSGVPFLVWNRGRRVNAGA